MDAIRFWQLTPAELCLEIEAWDQREQLTDYRVGLLCAVIAEPNRDVKKRSQPFTPQDFMPVKNNDRAPRQLPKQDWQQQLSIVERLNTAFGGEDLRR